MYMSAYQQLFRKNLIDILENRQKICIFRPTFTNSKTEVTMKTLIVTFIAAIALLLSPPLQSNPIPPPNLIVEVYFDDSEWVLVVDNMYLWAWGLEDFEDVAINSSGGLAYINPDVVPDPDESVTLLTVDDLTLPLEIDPVEDHIVVWVSEGYTLCDLEWGPDPDDIVSGPEPWQSIVISCVAFSPDWDYIFWPVKGASHNCYATSCSKHGVFTGYVTDQYGNPVPDAEICYLSDNLLFSDFGFGHIITGVSGQYQHNYMPARNYHIGKIMFDDTEYPADEYISIEPGDTTIMNFTIYLTGLETLAMVGRYGMRNYPNPFTDATTFTVIMPDENINHATTIEIYDMLGNFIEQIPVGSNGNKRKEEIYWNPGSGLQPGNYLAKLKSGNRTVCTHKITIK